MAKSHKTCMEQAEIIDTFGTYHIPKLKLLVLLNLVSSSSRVTLENFLDTKLFINLIRVVPNK